MASRPQNIGIKAIEIYFPSQVGTVHKKKKNATPRPKILHAPRKPGSDIAPPPIICNPFKVAFCLYQTKH